MSRNSKYKRLYGTEALTRNSSKVVESLGDGDRGQGAATQGGRDGRALGKVLGNQNNNHSGPSKADIQYYIEKHLKGNEKVDQNSIKISKYGNGWIVRWYEYYKPSKHNPADAVDPSTTLNRRFHTGRDLLRVVPCVSSVLNQKVDKYGSDTFLKVAIREAAPLIQRTTTKRVPAPPVPFIPLLMEWRPNKVAESLNPSFLNKNRGTFVPSTIPVCEGASREFTLRLSDFYANPKMQVLCENCGRWIRIRLKNPIRFTREWYEKYPFEIVYAQVCFHRIAIKRNGQTEHIK